MREDELESVQIGTGETGGRYPRTGLSAATDASAAAFFYRGWSWT